MLIAGCEFPDMLWYHVEHQVWAHPQGDGTARVGISSLGIKLAGEIYMCRPKSVGSVVEQGRSIAVVELAKSIVSVKSPVRGQVVEVNARLAETPELVHRDPYGDGWLARVALGDWAADTAALLHGEPVAPAMQRHAMLHRVDG
jgi:glycine cleavage system H protein